MLKKYKGILVYSKIYKENDLFVKFLSNEDEVVSGIVYGGQSKKKKNILQLGFFLNFNVVYINNKPPSISMELTSPYISNIIHDKYKLRCLLASTSLLNISIIEGQKIINLYEITEIFFNQLVRYKKWFKFFCIYLFEVLKHIGYDIDYTNNKKYLYFNFESLSFEDTYLENSIIFPHELFDLNINKKIVLSSANNFFNVFEHIFNNFHLSNYNHSLPNQYILFKKTIIGRLKISE